MELTQQTFDGLTEAIHRLCGLVIGPDKMYLIRHRLEPLIRLHKLDGFGQLLQRMRSRGEAELCDAVIDAVTTQETSFFRDHDVFKAIGQHALPERAALLHKVGGKRQRIRIWSAGSATGQEAYSLAMLVREFVDADDGKKLRDSHFSIIGSDISPAALAAAQAGSYTRSEVARGLSESVLHRYFHAERSRWVVGELLRGLVHFRRFNLLHSPNELGPFDIVLCRNVLIYFDDATRKKICKSLYEILHHGGWLALGSAESLYGIEDRMQAVHLGKAVLYRKP